MKLTFKCLTEGSLLPEFAHAGDAGMDLVSDKDIQWMPIFAVHQGEFQIIVGYKAIVTTGLAIQLPRGHEGMVRSRSGLAYNDNIFVLNSPGCIDETYRGEIKVILMCIGELPKKFKNGIPKGTKVAQLIVNKVENKLEIEASDKLDETDRGEGGFGSTGLTK